MSSFFKPTIPKPAAAAAPVPEGTAKRLETADRTTSRSVANSKRRGRDALRIDLQAGGAGADGTGVNVPSA